ncbi:hypothetical protein [Spirosoma endbachense]|uniref:Uncharacterized protein n=1 Tax=Spirosoma endbachense TaxID=2666025 RepID=A0A6P1W1M7_9BACT|nr:hypothetical protein [Spirosoma endbachense]QHV98794.1 hypothetical protein GJR95_28995 [Spirosoma endbachense]
MEISNSSPTATLGLFVCITNRMGSGPKGFMTGSGFGRKVAIANKLRGLSVPIKTEL